MIEDNRATENNRIWPVILAVIIIGTLFRLLFNQGTLAELYTENVFRVGLIPWSDARGWVDGALSILSGDTIKGVSAFRPLTPLFLSDLFFITGIDYWRGIIAQTILLLATAVTAAIIMRNVKPRSAVLIFLVMICQWRPGIETTFITEIPGIIVLIPAIAMLWRGTMTGRRGDIFTGLLLFGLNQAIRPWNIISLFLLPFMAFHGTETLKRKTGLFAAYLACGMMGFMFHPLAATIFNGPGEASGNEDKALIGRVTGSNWMAYYFDPEIRKIREQREITPAKLRRFTYIRAWELFKQCPQKIFITIKESYAKFFTGLRWQMGEHINPGLWLAIGLLVMWVMVFLRGTSSLSQAWNNWSNKNKTITAVSLFLLIIIPTWFLLAAAIWGLIRLLRCPKALPTWMMILYWAGIILSLPLVGDDAGLRNKIAGDIIMYIMAAGGLSHLWFGKEWKITEEIDLSTRGWKWKELNQVILTTIAAIVIFIAIPLIIRVTAIQPEDHNWNVSPSEITVPPGVILLDQEKIEAIWNKFPLPSFEKYNGAHAFWVEDFRLRDVVYAPANKGLERTHNIMQFWPLASTFENRCLVIREMHLAIIPRINREQLSVLDGRKVILYGELITRPRTYLFATGYVLYVLRIGIRADDGKIEWVYGKK